MVLERVGDVLERLRREARGGVKRYEPFLTLLLVSMLRYRFYVVRIDEA